MKNIQPIFPQILFLICSFIALYLSFFVIGLSNFTWIEWIAVVLATFGLFGNSFVILAKLKNIE